MIERLAAENKRAERNYQFRESIKQKHIRGEDFFSFTFCWNNQAKMIKEMKWKKKKAYAFKDKSQLPGPRCIASQEFSIKVLFFFKSEYYLRSQEFFINYSMLQIFHKINTDKNQPTDSSS